MDAGFLDQAQAGLRGVERRDVRGAGHEAVLAFGVADGAGLERERVVVREPAGKLGLELGRNVWADVQVGVAGAAAEPLQRATGYEVHGEVFDVYGHGAE